MGPMWSFPAKYEPTSPSESGIEQAGTSQQALTPPPPPASTTRAGSLSSSSATRTITMCRARLKRRRQRARSRGLPGVSRVITVHGGSSAVHKQAASQVATQLVGERVLIHWPRISAWVECEVVEYGGDDGMRKGHHRVRYIDGICEWKELTQIRIVLGTQRFARAIRAGQKTSAKQLRGNENSEI